MYGEDGEDQDDESSDLVDYRCEFCGNDYDNCYCEDIA